MRRAKTDSDCDTDADSEIPAVIATLWDRNRYRDRNRLLFALRRPFFAPAALLSKSNRLRNEKGKAGERRGFSGGAERIRTAA